ncbi:glycosyltransferase family 2 protein [Paeniglutamicibacter antarcticus]
MVSVIVPVYNTETYLPHMLDSLVAQDMSSDEFEVVAVDDGSTDTSGAILDEYATRFPHIRVFHQANSGWAGKPRNVALGHSRGTYVFFADADDLLAPQALRRMVDFAEANKLDVVMPKVVGIGGRKQTSSLYSKTDPSVTPLQALKSMTPQKLVARSLIEQNQLRFAEEPVRLEDGMFMVACYLKAKGIGVIADSDFYSLRQRADGSNISYRPLVPQEYSDSIGKIAAIIKSMAKNQDLADAMLLSLWTRKGLKIYVPPRFKRYSHKIQAQWLEAHSALLDSIIPGELSLRLSDIHHAKTEAIRRGDIGAVLATNEIEAKLTQTVSVSGATTVDGNLFLTGRASGEGIERIKISAEQRGKRGNVHAEAILRVENGVFSGELPGVLRGDTTFDFFVHAFIGDLRGPNRRLASEEGSFSAGKLLEPYMTKNGYFSVRSSTLEAAEK